MILVARMFFLEKHQPLCKMQLIKALQLRELSVIGISDLIMRAIMILMPIVAMVVSWLKIVK